MSDDPNGSTCWTLILDAAEGDERRRASFAQRYASVVRAYLLARWRGSPLTAEVDDAVQEVFVECFREDGALARVDRERASGFRPYLYGIARNVARRVESARARARRERSTEETDADLDALGLTSDEASASVVFDRAFAQRIVREAARHQERSASDRGPEAERRVELLRLRLQEGRPIRDIASDWDEDAERLHREYALARTEFQRSLVEVLAFYYPDQPEAAIREGQFLLALLR